jgi:hypothetical protein
LNCLGMLLSHTCDAKYRQRMSTSGHQACILQAPGNAARDTKDMWMDGAILLTFGFQTIHVKGPLAIYLGKKLLSPQGGGGRLSHLWESEDGSRGQALQTNAALQRRCFWGNSFMILTRRTSGRSAGVVELLQDAMLLFAGLGQWQQGPSRPRCLRPI